MFAYIGKEENTKPFLRLNIQYVADDWLFIEKFIFNVDGKTYTISSTKYGEFKRDNGSGQIWEWLDRSVGASELKIIKAVANSKSTKVRFQGDKYYKDRTISSREK